MGTVSKNGFDLIKIAGSKIKGNFFRAFVGTLTMFAPLIALCFIPYAGWAISVFLFGVFETGYIRFMRKAMSGERPSLTLIFSEFKTGWLEIFLGAIMIILFLLGSVLLIVPGVMLVCYYSMSLFMAEHYKTKTVGEAMYLSQSKMNGNIASLLSYKSIFWLIYLVVFAIGALGGWGVYILYCNQAVWGVLVGIIAAIVFILLFSLVTLYYHLANETFFQEVLIIDENKKAKRAQKANAAKAEVKQEEVAETANTQVKTEVTENKTNKTINKDKTEK